MMTTGIVILENQMAILKPDDSTEITVRVANEAGKKVVRVRCDGHLIVVPVCDNGINLRVE